MTLYDAEGQEIHQGDKQHPIRSLSFDIHFTIFVLNSYSEIKSQHIIQSSKKLMNFQYLLYQPYVSYVTQPVYIQYPVHQISLTYYMAPTSQTEFQGYQGSQPIASLQNVDLPQAQVSQVISPERLEATHTAQGPRGRGPRRRIPEKELESAKKNSESNIINQMLSFYNQSQKCQRVVEKIVGMLGRCPSDSEKIKAIFYNIVRLINFRRGRKYVNRNTIKGYFSEDQFLKNIPDIQEKLSEVNILSLPELTKIMRIAFSYFVKSISISALLTSKRVSMAAKNEHLKRRRRVKACFCSPRQ